MTVKALELTLRKAPRMACCPRCPGDVPLIATFLFNGAEFYCLDCGAQISFVGPKGVEETPEILADYESRQAEWDEHVVPLKGDREAQIAWLEQRRGSVASASALEPERGSS